MQAIRDFQKAIELDSGFALAYWGVAYSHAENYNFFGQVSSACARYTEQCTDQCSALSGVVSGLSGGVLERCVVQCAVLLHASRPRFRQQRCLQAVPGARCFLTHG